MPRRRAPPRLYLDPKRKTWVIRDAASFHRLGLPEGKRDEAEKQLAEYLAQKHKPRREDDPLISDVLNVYQQEHLPHTVTGASLSYSIISLGEWWGDKRLSDITAETCREYAGRKYTSRRRPTPHSAPGLARRQLELLRAAVRLYCKSRRLAGVPVVTLPPKPEARSRWLTRSEAARLLWAVRRVEHLRRFIILGLYTGSRSKNIFGLKWDQIDLAAGVMRRRAFGEREESKKRAPPVRLGRRLLSHLWRWARLDAARMRSPVHVITFEGQPIRKFSMTWPAAIEKAGLKGTKVTPHTLRHTCVTWKLRAGATPWEVGGFVGMASETVTRVYGHHSPSFQERVANL